MRVSVMCLSVGMLCFLIIVCVMVILIPDNFAFIFQEWEQLVAVSSALGTIVAAVATWRAAKEASKSAKIAQQSMEISAQHAELALKETQNFNRRSGFENRYALLLQQHNHYHLQVCEHLDSNKNKDKHGVNDFFNNALVANGLPASLSFLTGHEIISRYMRTLYHLLKFVNDEFYVEKDALQLMKNYTSPLRSTVRNDVLYLIAVNALNVTTENAIKSGYPRYQALLHTFDFFEHAVFLFPFEPTKVFLEVNSLLIKQNMPETVSGFQDKLHDNLLKNNFIIPDFYLLSPVLLCLIIYDNPMKNIAKIALKEFGDYLLNGFEKKLTERFSYYEEYHDRIQKVSNWKYRTHSNEEFHPVTFELMREIMKSVSENKGYVYDYFYFKAQVECDLGYDSMYGERLVEYIVYVNKYKKLYKEIGGVSEVSYLVGRLNDELTARLEQVYIEAGKYLKINN
ncbi:hypothetical protein H0249_18180 [Pectobacterium brasiliense]|uniref:putative phage abortive infection protein n=2 Tax=Pectobacterium brasiliense TaxID=180957 RepID=UPI0017F754F7|nr:putative phage abortive infection protein [Pectobacterium brasiliense]MBA0198440.1 hypothetical protein [Pectobacterium brasiliense]